MTETAELCPPDAPPPPEDQEAARRKAALSARAKAALRSVLKRRIMTLYCFGFLTVKQTQRLINHFRLWEA